MTTTGSGGTPGNDVIPAQQGWDVVSRRGGNDVDDVLNGRAGNDKGVGGSGTDSRGRWSRATAASVEDAPIAREGVRRRNRGASPRTSAHVLLACATVTDPAGIASSVSA